MSAKITCHIKGKSVVFYRGAEDAGFHSVPIDTCKTIPEIKQLSEMLAKEEWADASIVEAFQNLVVQYHNLHLPRW